MDQNIEDLGKGLVGIHPRDTDPNRFQLLGLPTMTAVGAVTDVFDTPSGNPFPPDENQGGSSSCTAQAFCYYFWAWTGIQLSRQSLYSEYHLPGGGGYLVDPFRMMMDNLKKIGSDGKGGYTRDQHQDPKPQTEANMIIKVNIPGQERKVFKIRYWNVPYNDIVAVATAIKAWKGCVIGVNGNNTDWSDKTHPKVPSHTDWSHALYCPEVGYDRNEPAVIAKSSWCSSTHNKHYIIKDYFTSGNVFSPIVMEVTDITNSMDDTLIINYKGTYGLVRISDGRVIGGALAANPTEMHALEQVFEKTVIKPDGSFFPADITYGI